MRQPPPPVPEGRRPYKNFVSSTYLDNQERRKLVQDAITMAGMVWHGLHYVIAKNKSHRSSCKSGTWRCP